MSFSRRRVAGLARVLSLIAILIASAVLPAFGAALQVLVDADNNLATGCSVATPAGAFPGVEQRFTTTVDTTVAPPLITGVTREDCNTGTGTFGAPVVTSAGGWSVGVGNGTGGSNVIETSLPFPPGSRVIRLGFVYADPAIGSDALIEGNSAIVLALFPDPTAVPTLSSAMLALLAVLLGGAAYHYLRRNGIPVGPMALVLVTLMATMAWAAIVLDGLTGDWAGTPPIATDPSGDAPNGSDILAVFVRPEAPTLFVRADVRTGLPPTAAADSYTATPGVTLSVPSSAGLLANDTLGTPAAAVVSFGGGSLGGAVTSNAAGTVASFGAGGSLSVNIDGVMTFTPPTGFASNFTFSYRIANLNGTSDALVTIAPRLPPAFTSANAATFTVGSAGTFNVMANGLPAPSFALTSGTLPAGVTFSAAGVLSGTPASGTVGTYALTFTASNGVSPNATQAFTLTVNQSAAITSANAATFVAGTPGTFTITTSGTPVATTLSETGGLPAGVTFVNNGNGTATLGGMPGATTGGVYALNLTASNGVGAPATQSFTLTVNQAPAITSANVATFTAGTAGSFTITTTGFPNATLSSSGALPSGVTFTNNGNGTATLAGMPAAATGGTYPISITAANGVGANATQAFTLTVDQSAAITSANAATFVAGTPGTFTITTSGTPVATTLSETGGLPAGVTFVNNGNGTATLGGMPGATTGGVYALNLTASNGVGAPATQSFTLTVVQSPTIVSANNATFTVGTASSFAIVAAGFPAPALSSSGALPSGMSFTDNGNGTATLAGNPAAGTGGTYPLLITASGFGPAASQAFTLFVQEGPTANPDSYTVVHDSVLASGSSILANDSGVPAPTLASVTGSGAPCAAFPCAIATANGTATVASDGTFTYTPAANFAGADGFTYVISNVVGPSGAAVTINVTDAAPVVDLSGGATAGIDFGPVTFTEGGGPVAIVDPAQLTVTDADGTQLASATVVISNLLDSGAETVGVTCPDVAPGCSGAILAADVAFTTSVGPPATGTLSITRVAPLADYQALLRTLTYNNASLAPTASPDRDITVTVNDGIVDNAPVAHATVAVSAVNNAPTITAPASVTTPANTAFTFSGTVSVADADSGSAPVQVVLTATNGTATLSGTAGLTVLGNGTASVTATGPIASQVAALNGLAFTPTPGFGGAASLKIDINDQGNTGSGGPKTATATVAITVNQAPTITSAGSATFTLNLSGSFTVTATGTPGGASMVIGETGALPAGVNLVNNGDGTATLAGTPTTGGVFPITITANNGVTPNASQSFTLTVNTPPAITSANNATFKVGTGGSFQVTTSGTPTGASMIISQTGALPSGVTFTNNNDGTATLAGTPAAAMGGTYPITINAGNGVTPAASQSFTLTVQQAPAITSGSVASFNVNQAGTTFNVTTTGFPTNASMSITESGSLPAGLTFTNNNNGTATLAGTPTVAGSFPITVTANNGVTPNATQSFTINVNQAPAITSATSATFSAGVANSFLVTTTGSPTVTGIARTGDALPAGVTYTYTSGPNATLGGTPTSTGTYAFTFTASNGIPPDATQSFTLNVACPAISVGPGSLTSAVLGAPYGPVAFSASGGSGSYSFSLGAGSPPGLSFTGSSLGGTPNTAGTYTFTVTATDTVSGCTGATTYSNFIVGITIQNDTFGTVIGNTLVDSSLVPFSVVDNDTIPPTATITAFDATSAQNGTVTMVTSGASMGQFTYDPPRGFTGTDTFTYTVTAGAASASATVTINVSGRVWYVNNGPSACLSSCDGRLSHPYTSLSSFNTANTGVAPNPQNGDTIFVYSGSGPYTGPLTLRTSQRLMGQGSTTAFIDASLPAANGQSLPTVGAFPNINAQVTFTTGNKLDGFDMDGASAVLNASSATGFTVNLGRFRRSAATATTAISLGGSGNTGSFDFHSLSATGAAGGASGVSINNFTGHFNVAGTDSGVSPNGGTISGYGRNGMEFIGVTNAGTAVSLTNMTLTGNAISQTVAGNAATCGGDLVGGNNLSCVANLFLQNSNGISLNAVTVSNSGQMGINGNNVNTFSIGNSTVSGNGNEALENGITFQNLKATNSITDTNVINNHARQIYVENDNGSTTLNVTRSALGTMTIGNSSRPAAVTDSLQGILFNGHTAATMTLNADGLTVQNNAGVGIESDMQGSSNLSGHIQTSMFNVNVSGISLQVGNSSSIPTFTIASNTQFTGNQLEAINIATTPGSTGPVSAIVFGNTIGTSGVSGSACDLAFPTGAQRNCAGVTLGRFGTNNYAVRVSNNTIQQFGNNGIIFIADQPGTVNTKLINNNIREPYYDLAVPFAAANAIQSNVGPSAGVTACVDISGNTTDAGIPGFGWDPNNVNATIYTRVRNASVVSIPGYSGGNNAANVQTYIAGVNSMTTPAGGTKVFADNPTGSFQNSGGACATP